MANEIRVSSYGDGLNLYVTIRTPAGLIWDVGDSALEAVGTWNDARADECDIALTGKDGEYYTADIPAALPNGVYIINLYEQAGANPDTDDNWLGGEELNWPTDLRVVLAQHHYMSA